MFTTLGRIGSVSERGIHCDGISVSLAVGVPDSLALERAEATKGRVAATDVTGDPTLATENGRGEVTRVAGGPTVTASAKRGAVTLTDR